MTLKKAYINLLTSLIIMIATVMLSSLKVSRLNISWTMTLFWMTAILSIFSIGLNIYQFKRKTDKITDSYLKKHQFHILDWFAFLSISMMFILVIFMFFILPTNVDGSSMKSTLLDGERVLMYHYNYSPKNNDVIIVHIADHYTDTTGHQVNASGDYDDPTQVYFVKRVVAIPGDVITFQEIETNDVYHILINGKVYQNQYYQVYSINDLGRLKLLSQLGDQNQLKDNQFLAFGDNESFSFDSRNIGTIYEEDVIGKAIYKLMPLGGISNG